MLIPFPGPSILDPQPSNIAILGSGFAGCLTALILNRIGLSVVVVDKAAHPRFAIGESSTPAADMLLHDLAERYDLPRLTPLCRYGSWCETYPDVSRGLKRGFSYFRHEPGESFRPDAEHRNELLVAASASDAVGDTHWFRADVDAFLAGEVRAAGIPLLEETGVTNLHTDEHKWTIHARNNDGPVTVAAEFVIDAAGDAGLLAGALGIDTSPGDLCTHSRALFSHFRYVEPWADLLQQSGGSTADHPFRCDAAAVHHVFDDGWMWELRFDNGVTSAGFAFDSRKRPRDETLSPEEEWRRELERLPSLAEQFADAELVDPPGRLIRTGRLQRRARRTAGANWAMLPHAAGFIDPLHSTGIAHTLCGIERLAVILKSHWGGDELAACLADYDAVLQNEFTLIDRLVAGCYDALPNFRLFAATSMLYFAAATTFEQRRRDSNGENGCAFLLADDPRFRSVVEHCTQRAAELAAADATESDVAEFESQLAAAIAPYNTVGLCDPSVRNMYRHTAAEKP